MPLLIDALRCQNTNRPPVWLMRQAGRYLPQYQKIRKDRSLVEMFHCPETICQVTKLPLHLGVDALILFSDILMVLDALNISWNFEEGKGPIVEFNAEIGKKVPNLIEKYPFESVAKGISYLKQEISLPLLGFAGAPFTIASYLFEKKGSKDLGITRRIFYSHPQWFTQILDILTDAIIQLLKIQIGSGVDAIQIFDSWASSLSLPAFQTICIPYYKKILAALTPFNIPIIVFCRGTAFFLQDLISLAPSCISVDWSVSLKDIRTKIPKHIAIQGNLDPCLLFASKETLKLHINNILDWMDKDPGFIFNLGHGVLPETPVENVQFLIERIHAWNSPKSS